MFFLWAGNFFGDKARGVAKDYTLAVEDMVQDMKNSPRKASFYLSLLTAGAVLAKTNPSHVRDSFFHVSFNW